MAILEYFCQTSVYMQIVYVIPCNVIHFRYVAYKLVKAPLYRQGWGELKNELELFNSIHEFELKDFHRAEF